MLMARWLCGIRHEVLGRENLPQGPYVICSKHQSAWETIAYYGIFRRRISFVVKRSLLWIPFFGWGLRLCMSPIPIDRSAKLSAFRSVLSVGKSRLDEGVPVCVFPEGTRVPAGERRKFLPGACMLAVEAGVPIVPVAHNSGRLWPKANLGLLKRSGTVTVSIGPPIATEGRRTKEVTAEAERWVHEETERIGG